MVDKAEFSRKREKMSSRSGDDIPEALRDIPNIKIGSRQKQVFTIGKWLSLVGAIALGASLWYFSTTTQKKSVSNSSPISVASPTPKQTTKKANVLDSNSELLGHFAYSEAPQTELQPIVSDGRIKLRKAAAQKFKTMVAAARARGVILLPISGFRSIATQEHLFFDIKAQRGQVATKRATISAPPGYSEHHTGYAVDIGDATATATNLNPNFEKTRAFKWLSTNAAHFSFEMSFPKNNPQGVSYEPWHWRYVGDRHSLETFYKAKNIKLNKTSQ